VVSEAVVLALIGAGGLVLALVGWGKDLSLKMLADKATLRTERAVALAAEKSREGELNRQIDALRVEIDTWQERYYDARVALTTMEAERNRLAAQVEQLQGETRLLREKLAEVEQKLEALRRQVEGG
jgi:chromosome segregation ATPase